MDDNGAIAAAARAQVSLRAAFSNFCRSRETRRRSVRARVEPLETTFDESSRRVRLKAARGCLL